MSSKTKATTILDADAAKAHFFARTAEFLRTFTDRDGRSPPLLAAFPISLPIERGPFDSLCVSAFIDEGLLTDRKFRRFLSVADRLLRAIGSFEVIYVSISCTPFRVPRRRFWKRFTKLHPRVPDSSRMMFARLLHNLV